MSVPFVVAGVDGGASSTTCVIADSTGRVLGVGHGGPVDHLYRSTGRRRTRESLREAISSARRAARWRGSVRAVVAGLAGLERDSPESRIAVRIIRGLIRARVVRVTWDAEIAFAGATAGGPGIVIIAGTGSVALGRNAAGQIARAGGYGFLIDDAGGGVNIGQAALRAALRSADGRGRATRLAAMVRAHLGEWPEIRRRVYGDGGGRALLASLAPVVEEAAKTGDRVAQGILAEAGESLAGLGLAVARQLDMTPEPFLLVPVGGVFRAGRPVMNSLRRVVRSAAPHCRIRRPRFQPAGGAVLMALDAAGVRPTRSVLSRLSGSL